MTWLWNHEYARCLFLLVLAQALWGARGGSNKTAVGWQMPRHSFLNELNFDNGLENWLSSAASMALRNRVQLLPPVPQRHGLFWSKKVVASNDLQFSVNFTSFAQGVDDKGIFAFWVGPDDFAAAFKEQSIVETPSKKWDDGLAAMGLTFLSNKPSFVGLGVFFLAASQGSQPSVVAMWCDGNTPLSHENLLNRGGEARMFPWVDKHVNMMVRIQGDGKIKVSLGYEAHPHALEMNFQQTSLPKSFFFGFSGYTGSTGFVSVDLEGLSTLNYDTQKPGEDLKSIFDADTEKWMQVLEAEKRYLTQASQKEAVETLTKLLSDHVERCNALGDKLKGDLVVLEGRLDALNGDFNKLKFETEAWDFEKQAVDAQFVRDHIKGIGSVFAQDRQLHDTKMGEVQKVAGEIKEKGGHTLGKEGKAKMESVALQAKALETHSARGSTQTNGLLLMMLLAVTGLGCLFLNRMRYYEKKHYI